MTIEWVNHTDQPVFIENIDKQRYLDPAYLDLEWQSVWRNTWLLAGLESDVASPGDYFVFDLGREQVLVSCGSGGDSGGSSGAGGGGGKAVVREGEYDELLHVIKSGEAAVVRAPRGGEKATSKPLCTLRRGDCFGELCLASAAEGVKRTRRRTSVVAKGSEPLVLLTLSPDGCKGRRALEAWQRRMSQAISAEHVRGVDCVTVERLVESGKDVTSIFPKEAGGKASKSSLISSFEVEQDSDSLAARAGGTGGAPGGGGAAVLVAAQGHGAAASNSKSGARAERRSRLPSKERML